MKNIKRIMYNYKKNEYCNEIEAIKNNICQRCGYLIELNYCSNCEELGRIYVGDKLYTSKVKFKTIEYNGSMPSINLTKLQLDASRFLVNCKDDSLIWAVCGAGKTEITFATIYSYITKGEIVCFCIPRVDIVYEIYERLKKDFVGVKIAILTGEYKELIEAQIYVMTTNQILKFYNAFSLIIVDEVDAFPYMHNPKFDYGVNQAKNKNGRVIYLTSTPCDKILSKNMPTFTIPRRWHNYKLPVPIFIYSKFNEEKISYLLNFYLRRSKRQILLFISNIKKVEQFTKLLKSRDYKAESIYSNKKERLKVIESFKKKEIDILVTTTVLERGVTFDDIDVIVMDANNSHYSEAALIQIAGRVNRKKEYQDGKVFFLYDEITNNMKACNKKIKYLNKKKW